jgi:hypothetical protein
VWCQLVGSGVLESPPPQRKFYRRSFCESNWNIAIQKANQSTDDGKYTPYSWIQQQMLSNITSFLWPVGAKLVIKGDDLSNVLFLQGSSSGFFWKKQ